MDRESTCIHDPDIEGILAFWSYPLCSLLEVQIRIS